MATRAQRLVQPSRVDLRDRVLAGGIDVCDIEHVGGVEGVEEIIEQIAQAREAMGLKNRERAALETGAGGGQSGSHLGRMMRVIVEHYSATGFALDFESSVDA